MSIATRLGLVLATLMAVAAPFLLFRGLRQDDAYITYQFARNISSGRGFTFNPGERVLGATSPLHTLLLAAAYSVAGDSLAEASILIGAVGLVAQSWFLLLLLRRDSARVAALVAAVTWAGLAAPHGYLPLETNLFAGLVLGTLWAWREERPALCGALLGTAFLCRYDAGLLILVVVVAAWSHRRRSAAVALAVSFGVVAPWLIWSTWYFGSFLPQTFWAKLSVMPFLPYLKFVLREATVQPWQAAGLERLAAPLAPLTVGGWILGGVMVWRRYRAFFPFAAFAGALLVSYAWIGPSPDHRWHTYPSLLALDLLVVLGVGGLTESLVIRSGPGVKGRALFAAMAATLVLAVSVRSLEHARQFPGYLWYGWRDGVYRKVAAWIDAHLSQEASILASEVGTLGYLTRHRMIDPYGLIGETNDYPRTRSVESLLGLVRYYRPDVILADDSATAATLERSAGYVIVRHFEWQTPWSILLVRAPQVLRNPAELDRLRARLAAPVAR